MSMMNRFIRGAQIPRNVRRFSSDAETAQHETARWFKLSCGMIGLTTVVSIYTIVNHSHEHPGRSNMEYLHIRNKPYPWSCPDCNLFHGACWDACRGTSKPTEAHH